MNDKINNIKKALKEKIEYENEDTFINHLKTFRKQKDKLCGRVYESGFKIWEYDNFIGGIVHPVIEGTFTYSTNQPKIVIKTKINIVGKLYISIILPGWGLATFLFVNYREGVWNINLGTIIAWFFLLAVFIVPLVSGYNLSKRMILYKIEETIKSV